MHLSRRFNPRIAALVVIGFVVAAGMSWDSGGTNRLGGGRNDDLGNVTQPGQSSSPVSPLGTAKPSAPAATPSSGGVPSPVPSSSDAIHSPVPTSPAAVPPPKSTPTMALRYTFDGPAGVTYTDTRGLLALHLETANGGTLTAVPHGAGNAVGYPEPCATVGSPDCPRAVLTSGPAAFLNPGTRDIRYGATVLLASDATSSGENIVQKGVSTTGVSQFKLQIDGLAGDPSCVMVSVGSYDIYVALSTRTVADGQWHRILCVRTEDSLAVLIDGEQTGSVSIPPSLAVNNDLPLQLGGRGAGPGNDQFNGKLDDVFVEILG